jgi:hypothetical protein
MGKPLKLKDVMNEENGGTITFFAFASALLFGAYQLLMASGWVLGPQLYMGIFLLIMGVVIFLIGFAWKAKYGVVPEIDLAEVDAVIAKLHVYRDFVKEHADVQLAMIDMSIQLAKATNQPQTTINKMEALRSQWATFLSTL